MANTHANIHDEYQMIDIFKTLSELKICGKSFHMRRDTEDRESRGVALESHQRVPYRGKTEFEVAKKEASLGKAFRFIFFSPGYLGDIQIYSRANENKQQKKWGRVGESESSRVTREIE